MASVNKCECDVGENLEISRGEFPEIPSLNLSKIENLIVYDEHGREIRVGDIYKYQKTILILVRVSQLFVAVWCANEIFLVKITLVHIVSQKYQYFVFL